MKKSAKSKIAVIVLFTVIAAMGLGVFTSGNGLITAPVKSGDALNEPLSASILQGSYDFEISAPNSSSNWMTGSTQVIRWVSNEPVNLELYRDDSFLFDIASNVASNTFMWDVPSNLTAANNYQISIVNSTDSSIYDFSSDFNIYSIAISEPDSSAYWMSNSTHLLNWTSDDSITDVVIELVQDDVVVETIEEDIPNIGEYNWTIPIVSRATNYQIKISNFANLSTFDLSDSFEIYSIEISEPNSSAYWMTNTSHVINWTSDANIDHVDIELMLNGEVELVIVNTTLNDGLFNWSIPSGLPSDTSYQIRINSSVNDSVYDIGEEFEIYSFEITTPSSLRTNSTHDINWEYDMNFDSVILELYLDGVFYEFISNDSVDGTHTWAVSTGYPSSTNYQIRITNGTNTSVYDISETFEIYSFNVTMPDGSASWKTSTSHSITWDSDPNILKVDLKLYREGEYIRNISSGTANDGSFYWEVLKGLPNSLDYQIRISEPINDLIRDFSTSFEIYTNTITVLYPDNDFLLKNGTSSYISWETVGYISEVDIDLYEDDVHFMSIASSVIDDGMYDWVVDVDFNVSARYQIKITESVDLSVFYFGENFTISPTSFLVDTPSNISWNTEEMYSILWRTTDFISYVKIELYDNGELVHEIWDETPNDRKYRWGIPPSINSSKFYQIKIVDVNNESNFSYSDFFEIVKVDRTEDPTIPGYTPIFILISSLGIMTYLLKLTRRRNR